LAIPIEQAGGDFFKPGRALLGLFIPVLFFGIVGKYAEYRKNAFPKDKSKFLEYASFIWLRIIRGPFNTFKNMNQIVVTLSSVYTGKNVGDLAKNSPLALTVTSFMFAGIITTVFFANDILTKSPSCTEPALSAPLLNSARSSGEEQNQEEEQVHP
jgi:hypothetical protein